MLPNACASNVCKAMMALAESEEGRHALLTNAGTMFHIKRQMMSDDDSVCSDASLLYLALQEQADGRSSSIALPRAICKLSLQLTGTGGRDSKRLLPVYIFTIVNNCVFFYYFRSTVLSWPYRIS
jgi:hypothetical protein